ncbi:Protein of unknown function [Marininema mesophilum]|uniref:Uncharacterized protein n=1 Tax=Marininema mesophilum TaxID=1048340 RepID=A0A1H3ABL1_9BACL|nr:DUF3238 domain-containing protein [Marininema mesophilum]SDX27107.1 Protein of unknown function [Marininema mesophilum]
MRNIKLYLILFVTFTIIIISIFPIIQTDYVKAKSNSKLNQRFEIAIKSETNAINLDWNDIGDHYVLESIDRNGDQKTLFSNQQNYYKVNHLETGNIYKFRLTSYNKKNSPIDSAIINTQTLKSPEQISKMEVKKSTGMHNKNFILNKASETQYSIANSFINTIVSEDEIKIQWVNVPDEDNKYEVYKDDKLVKIVEGNTFVDKNIKGNTNVKYSVKGSKKSSAENINIRKKALSSYKIKLNKENEKDLSYEEKEVATIINYTNINKVNSKTNKSYPVKIPGFELPPNVGVVLNYTTFIPQDRVPNPYCIAPVLPTSCDQFDEFNGNNRDFDMWSEEFKTRSHAYVTWDQKTKKIIKKVAHNPQTNVTIGYKDNKEVKRAKASESDIKITDETFGDDWASFTMTVASSNPLLTWDGLSPSPNIDAFYTAKVYNNWDGDFYGAHDQAPSHEFYIFAYPSDSGLPLHKQRLKAFSYLFPNYPDTEWKVSVVNGVANGRIMPDVPDDLDNPQWSPLGGNTQPSNKSTTVQSDGHDFKAIISNASSTEESVSYSLYEDDADSTDTLVGKLNQCKVRTSPNKCIWTNTNKYIDGDNKKAEFYVKQTSTSQRLDLINLFDRKWTKVGEDSEFTLKSDRFSSSGGDFKANITVIKKDDIVNPEYALYEDDEDGSRDDYVGMCKITNNSQECTWENIGNYVDGTNKKAEFYLKNNIEGTDNKLKATFYD